MASNGSATLDAAHKQQLLERIRGRFASRPFVGGIVVVPDYHLGTGRGFAGLEGVQRLFDAATDQLIGNFNPALTAFESDVHNGTANVRVVARNPPGVRYGGGSLDAIDLIALSMLSGAAAASRSRRRPGA